MVNQWIDDHVCLRGKEANNGIRREYIMTTHGKNKDQPERKGKRKVPSQADIKKESKYFFCKKNGQIKKDYVKFQQWLKKKRNAISCVCYESNMVEVSHNTWWIDSGSTIPISNSL